MSYKNMEFKTMFFFKLWDTKTHRNRGIFLGLAAMIYGYVSVFYYKIYFLFHLSAFIVVSCRA